MSPHFVDPDKLDQPQETKRKYGDLPERSAMDIVQGARTEKGTTLNKYTTEDVEVILRLLAFNGGNCARTASQVKDEYNIDIHPQAIQKWSKESFPNKYADIQRTLADELSDRVAGKVSDLAIRGSDVQGRILEQLDDALDREEDIPIKELAPSLRNVAQATDLNMKAHQLLRDKPTSIVENRTIEETIEWLEEEELLIDIPDAEVIEDLSIEESNSP